VTNWAAYNNALRQRGGLRVRFIDAALSWWPCKLTCRWQPNGETYARRGQPDGSAARHGNHPRRRALLLVNQHARRRGEAIEAVLAAGGVTVEEHDDPKKDPIPETIRARAGAFDGVLVGGGDGTLHAAAPALVATGRPLGILPLGTGNDLARSLGIDPDPVVAARVIAEGQIRAVDLGEINGYLFWNVASLGLGVELAQQITAATKRRWGQLGYALAALRVLRRLRRFTAELAHEGRTTRVRTVQVAVGNGRHYGGGMTVAATAALDDGLLHG
jgi:YegS/Rv2252/BmrU family lipid kinase